jgi:uncharacterized protein
MGISNSFVHHLPDPLPFWRELQRLLKPTAAILIRDLLRPTTTAEVQELVSAVGSKYSDRTVKLVRNTLSVAMSFPQRFYRNLIWLVGIILSILLLIQPVSMAQSIDDWVSPQQQEGKRAWINDRADLLDWQTEIRLAFRINKLVGRTSAELAIATLPQVETGKSLRAFGLTLFNAWGIGKKDTNNGVLLLVSKNDRRIEIITGTGLGEVLPDAEVGRLIQQEIAPAFQQQEYATGMIQAVNAITQRLESRLPSTIFPTWMPRIFVWIPWLVAIAGAGWAIFGTVQVLVLSFTPVQVPIPSQGFKTDALPSSERLASFDFPTLLAKVHPLKSDRGEQKSPDLLINILTGGWIFGVGLMYGFWQFVLMYPEAEFWQSDRITLAVFGASGCIWWLWGLLVASRFIAGNLFWTFSLPLSLLTAAVLAFLGSLFGSLMMTAWSGTGVMGMLLVAILAALAWLILINPFLSFKRKRDYRSDLTGQKLQELTTQEIESVLTPRELSAQTWSKLEFRGWREQDLALPIGFPLTREQVYLLQRIDSSASVCAHCKSYAVDETEQTVEREIETPKERSEILPTLMLRHAARASRRKPFYRSLVL